jgi:hypothetical protein
MHLLARFGASSSLGLPHRSRGLLRRLATLVRTSLSGVVCPGPSASWMGGYSTELLRFRFRRLRAGLDFVFHMFFLVKYCKALEEGSFRSRSADFLWMLVFGARRPGSDEPGVTGLSPCAGGAIRAVLCLKRLAPRSARAAEVKLTLRRRGVHTDPTQNPTRRGAAGKNAPERPVCSRQRPAVGGSVV